jgi:hypothetical protein
VAPATPTPSTTDTGLSDDGTRLLLPLISLSAPAE